MPLRETSRAAVPCSIYARARTPSYLSPKMKCGSSNGASRSTKRTNVILGTGSADVGLKRLGIYLPVVELSGRPLRS